MASKTVTIRDAVIADFNAAGVSYFGSVHPFTATARWYDQGDNTQDGLGVYVLGDTLTDTLAARDRIGSDVSIIVHVNKKLTLDVSQEIDECDSLIELVELMAKFYRFQTPRVAGVGSLMDPVEVQLPSRKMLNKFRRFYAWTRLIFRVYEQ